VIGASVEEMGFDLNPTAGEVFRLLERGWETIPSIYDLPIDAVDVGLRPGSRDHEPIIGDSYLEGLYFAAGHYRNGVLLTPITAYELSTWITEEKPSEILKNFQLSRFYKEVIK
jgi:glycine oxidase